MPVIGPEADAATANHARTWNQVIFFIRRLAPLDYAKDPLFDRLQSSHVLWQILLRIRTDVDLALKELLCDMREIALVQDGWTDAMFRPYEGLWASGNVQGDHRTFCLGHLPLLRADADSIAHAIQKRLLKLAFLGAGQRVGYFVGDSASVNFAMVRLFGALTKFPTVMVPCAAHCYNNMIQALWILVRLTIRGLLIVIDAVRNKTKFRNLAQETQNAERRRNPGDRAGPVTIPTAISVRWYSLCKMLSASVHLRHVIQTYLATLADAKLRSQLIRAFRAQTEELSGVSQTEVAAITDEDVEAIILPPTSSGNRAKIEIQDEEWEQLRILADIFGIFKEVLEVVEADQYGTLADIWKGFLWIKDAITQYDQTEVVNGWRTAVTVWENWEARYPVIPSQVQRESIQRRLIPRFGPIIDQQSPEYATLVELVQELEVIQSVPLYQFVALLRPSNLTQLPPLLKNEVSWAKVVKTLKLIFDSMKHQNAGWRAEQDSITRQHEGSQRSRPRFSRTQDVTETRDPSEPRHTEWERYIQLEVPPADDADLWSWWHDHQKVFPVMYAIACSYLYVPATSAGVERMFSKARRVLSRLRLRLAPDKAEIMVFLSENIAIIEDLQKLGRVYW
jgi:hypothetical protein